MISPAEDSLRAVRTRDDLPEDLDHGCIMLMLSAGPLGVGELYFRLRRLGLVDLDPAPLDRALGALEAMGAVEEELPCAGPGEQRYRLTAGGAARLGLDADDLSGTRIMVERFLARYSERLVS